MRSAVVSICFYIAAVAGAVAAGSLPDRALLDGKKVLEASAALTKERYPDADRVLADDLVYTEYNADGTDVTWDDEFVKVLTEKGRRGVGSLTTGFDAFYDDVEILQAEIIKPDGRAIPVDIKKNSRVAIDHGQMGSNIYNPNHKRLALSIPGLEIGDIRHVLIRRETKRTRMPDAWCDYTTFEDDQPIAALTYEVCGPTNLPLKNIVLRSEITGTVSRAESILPDGRVRNTWTVRDVPQMFPEPNMPAMYTVVQRLMLSTLPDWQAVSRWYSQLCEKPLADVSDEMKAKVAELVKDCNTQEEKIHAVFTFVSQKVRYMGVTTEDVAPGYEPHPVNTTFKNRYGVCRDKAALLVAMLRLAGADAYPVLINAGPKKDPDVPQPYFNHAITGVRRADGTWMLMDSTNESTRDLFPAYLGNCSYLVATPEGENLHTSEPYPAEKELLEIATEGKLDENGAALFRSKLVFNGINDGAYRGFFLRSKKDKRRAFFESVLKRSFAGAEVLECDIKPEDLQDTKQPLSVALFFRVPDFPVRGETLDTIELPWLGQSFGYVNFLVGQTGLKERKYPLQTEIPCGVSEKLALELGTAMGAAKDMPPVQSIDRGHVEYLLDMNVKDGKLAATRKHLVKTVEFSPEEYQTLKRTLEEMEFADKLQPFFVAKKDATPPDCEVIFDRTETTLHSPESWTSVHTWQKKILTYNGTKKNAELKLSYNPAWQELDLVSAVVSNADGKVFSAGETEIHRMDAAWTASAPRYPAGKQLVVNLPGVEVGSVITLKTELRQKKAPFYSRTGNFGGFEAVKAESYTLNVPHSMPRPRFRLYQPQGVLFSVETNCEETVYRWEARDQKAVKRESALPPWRFFRPSLLLSYGEWHAYAAVLQEAFAKAAQEHSNADAFAASLVANCKDKRAKVLAIRNEVLRTIRVAGPSFLSLPLENLSSPDRTLVDRYGNAADRALLMKTMLDAVGVDAKLVFASGDTTDLPEYAQAQREIPQLSYFREPLVRVELDGEAIYLNGGTMYGELGATALDLAPMLAPDGSIGTVVAPAAVKDRDFSEVTFDFSANGDAVVTGTNWVFGAELGTFRRKYKEILPEELRRETMEIAGKIAASAEPLAPLVTELEASPGYTAYKASVRRFAIVRDGLFQLQLPDLAKALFPLTEDSRENPIFLRRSDEERILFRVILPKEFTEIQIAPEPFRWTLPEGLGEVSAEVKTSEEDGRKVLLIDRTIRRASATVPRQLYPALLDYNRLLSHPSSYTVVAGKVI